MDFKELNQDGLEVKVINDKPSIENNFNNYGIKNSDKDFVNLVDYYAKLPDNLASLKKVSNYAFKNGTYNQKSTTFPQSAIDVLLNEIRRRYWIFSCDFGNGDTNYSYYIMKKPVLISKNPTDTLPKTIEEFDTLTNQQVDDEDEIKQEYLFEYKKTRQWLNLSKEVIKEIANEMCNDRGFYFQSYYNILWHHLKKQDKTKSDDATIKSKALGYFCSSSVINNEVAILQQKLQKREITDKELKHLSLLSWILYIPNFDNLGITDDVIEMIYSKLSGISVDERFNYNEFSNVNYGVQLWKTFNHKKRINNFVLSYKATLNTNYFAYQVLMDKISHPTLKNELKEGFILSQTNAKWLIKYFDELISEASLDETKKSEVEYLSKIKNYYQTNGFYGMKSMFGAFWWLMYESYLSKEQILIKNYFYLSQIFKYDATITDFKVWIKEFLSYKSLFEFEIDYAKIIENYENLYKKSSDNKFKKEILDRLYSFYENYIAWMDRRNFIKLKEIQSDLIKTKQYHQDSFYLSNRKMFFTMRKIASFYSSSLKELNKKNEDLQLTKQETTDLDRLKIANEEFISNKKMIMQYKKNHNLYTEMMNVEFLKSVGLNIYSILNDFDIEIQSTNAIKNFLIYDVKSNTYFATWKDVKNALNRTSQVNRKLIINNFFPQRITTSNSDNIEFFDPLLKLQNINQHLEIVDVKVIDENNQKQIVKKYKKSALFFGLDSQTLISKAIQILNGYDFNLNTEWSKNFPVTLYALRDVFQYLYLLGRVTHTAIQKNKVIWDKYNKDYNTLSLMQHWITNFTFMKNLDTKYLLLSGDGKDGKTQLKDDIVNAVHQKNVYEPSNQVEANQNQFTPQNLIDKLLYINDDTTQRTLNENIDDVKKTVNPSYRIVTEFKGMNGQRTYPSKLKRWIITNYVSNKLGEDYSNERRIVPIKTATEQEARNEGLFQEDLFKNDSSDRVMYVLPVALNTFINDFMSGSNIENSEISYNFSNPQFLLDDTKYTSHIKQNWATSSLEKHLVSVIDTYCDGRMNANGKERNQVFYVITNNQIKNEYVWCSIPLFSLFKDFNQWLANRNDNVNSNKWTFDFYTNKLKSNLSKSIWMKRFGVVLVNDLWKVDDIKNVLKNKASQKHLELFIPLSKIAVIRKFSNDNLTRIGEVDIETEIQNSPLQSFYNQDYATEEIQKELTSKYEIHSEKKDDLLEKLVTANNLAQDDFVPSEWVHNITDERYNNEIKNLQNWFDASNSPQSILDEDIETLEFAITSNIQHQPTEIVEEIVEENDEPAILKEIDDDEEMIMNVKDDEDDEGGDEGIEIE